MPENRAEDIHAGKAAEVFDVSPVFLGMMYCQDGGQALFFCPRQAACVWGGDVSEVRILLDKIIQKSHILRNDHSSDWRWEFNFRWVNVDGKEWKTIEAESLAPAQRVGNGRQVNAVGIMGRL